MDFELRFYRWFLAQLLAALGDRSGAERVKREPTVAPRIRGQYSRTASGGIRFTPRQSNLVARPGQFLARHEGRGRAYGDGVRPNRPPDPPLGGAVVPLRRYPWAAPDPVIEQIYSYGGIVGVGYDPTLFDGQANRLVLVQDADLWFRMPGDPHNLMDPQYGDVRTDAEGDNTHVHGPNWFFPYAAGDVPGYEAYGLEVRSLMRDAYHNWPPSEPPSFIENAVPAFDDGAWFTLPIEIIRMVHFAVAAGHQFRLYTLYADPDVPSSGFEQFESSDMLAEDPLAQWPWDPVMVPWTARRYTAAGGADAFQSQVWQYTIVPPAALADRVISTYEFTPNPDYAPIHKLVEDYYTAGGPWSDGRAVALKGMPARNRLITDFWDLDGHHHDGTLTTPTPHLAVDARLAYDSRFDVTVVTVSLRYVYYAETAWTHTVEAASDDTMVYSEPSTSRSGVGYAIGSAFLPAGTVVIDPDVNSSPRLEFHALDTAAAGLYRSAMKLTVPATGWSFTGAGTEEDPAVRTLDPEFTNAQMALYWVTKGDDLRGRVVTDSAGDPVVWTHGTGDPANIYRPRYPGAVDAEREEELGAAAYELGFNIDGTLTITTQGRFSHTDFGPEDIGGGVLRMKHQEVFDDYLDDDGVTTYTKRIGRVLTLIPLGTVRALFPPTYAPPHDEDVWWDALSAVDEDAYLAYAANAGAMLSSAEATLPRPFSGTGSTFFGLAVAGDEQFCADALTYGGETIAMVLAADYSVAMSRAGESAWSGTLADLVPESVITDLAAAGNPNPLAHQRFLHPSWPTGLLTISVGGLRLAFRARTRDDVHGPLSAPLVLSHLVADDA